MVSSNGKILRDMSEEFIKEAKNFRMQMKWCSIICWIATLAFVFIPTKNQDADYSWLIIPIGGTILTFIYFSMDANIKKYEKLNNRNGK
jgi:L-asparagine transporter-like permease